MEVYILPPFGHFLDLFVPNISPKSIVEQLLYLYSDFSCVFNLPKAFSNHCTVLFSASFLY